MKKLFQRITTKFTIHSKEILKKIVFNFFYKEIDLRYQLQKIASLDTARYIKENLQGINSVSNKFEVHNIAIKNITLNGGEILEFGVYSGGTINYLAKKLPSKKIYGFDSFEGLPENWRDGFPMGKFNIKKSLPMVKKNVKLLPGWFNESIPKYLIEHNNNNNLISYLHIDCDLYSSTKTIFELLGEKIVSGSIIVFDEYFNYDGWENGEFLAFQEFINLRNLKYEYLTYNRIHEQVALKIL